MDLKHENTKVCKDDKGVYFLLRFGNELEKVYVNEFFEDLVESNEEFNLSISSPVRERARPPAFFESCDPIDRERICKELDLRPIYSPVRKDLNNYNYLLNILKQNPFKLGYKEAKISSIEDHKKWANQVKSKLKELLHYDLDSERSTSLSIEEGPQSEYKTIVMKKYYVQTAPYLKMPVILSHPKKIESPMPGIICLHGHNKGKINTIGMLESSSNSYYGIDLALRGYVTLSIDQWGWGERRGEKSAASELSEADLSLSALLLGLTPIGIRSSEVSRGIDFLKTFDFVSNRFGVIGQSGGGTTAAFSSVLDDRIDAAVISGYFCTMIESIFSLHHCPCNYIPHILEYFDLPDIMAARAPKPTFIVSGEKDGIFPQKGVQDAYSQLKHVYGLYNQIENLGIDVIKNTGHVFRGDKAYPWLDKQLKI